LGQKLLTSLPQKPQKPQKPPKTYLSFLQQILLSLHKEEIVVAPAFRAMDPTPKKLLQFSFFLASSLYNDLKM